MGRGDGSLIAKSRSHDQDVRYSSVRSEEVPCFATYHFRTGSRPTIGQMFFRIEMN